MPAEDKKENLKICVRIRPLKADEAARKYERALQILDKNMIILYEQISTKLDALRANRQKEQHFIFDRVFSESSAQYEVYEETTKQLIPFVLQGYNATVFAYGPTGTGKTFTMVGTAKQPGVMVMALNDLFNLMKTNPGTVEVNMSYIEIYNEHIRDLLVPRSQTLNLREDPRTGVIQVVGLSKITTTSTVEVMNLLQKGNQRRSCESTAANKTSSRSHALLQINVKMSAHEKSKGVEVKIGRLFMIDLAGSERARNTQNVGIRLQEGAHINKSLLALGNVINALAEGEAKFVNFRDSKLTRLLKDALTGNCKTVMITHVSPANAHREESRNTLIYADKAKKISTKTRQNKLDVQYHVSQYQEIISELKAEIRRLKLKLGEDECRINNVDSGRKISEKGTCNLNLLKNKLVNCFNEQMILRKKLMDIDSSLLLLSFEFEKLNEVVKEFENLKTSKNIAKRVSENSNFMKDESDEDPVEVRDALDDLFYINNEQKRYMNMKNAVKEELQKMREWSRKIEENLPNSNTFEEREILSLLCKINELEMNKLELTSAMLLKDHSINRLDLTIKRYEKQIALSEKIITNQRYMIDGKKPTENLDELYTLYALECITNNKTKISQDEDFFIRPNSGLLKKFERLPSIATSGNDSEKLFTSRRRSSILSDLSPRIGTPLSIFSSYSSKSSEVEKLPTLNNRPSSFTSLSSLESQRNSSLSYYNNKLSPKRKQSFLPFLNRK